MSRDVTEVTKWAMVELIRESGYLSLENISLRRSHSVVNRSQVDDKRKARFNTKHPVRLHSCKTICLTDKTPIL